MRNESLTYRRCLQYVLCGISSRFQLLSPSHRQVAHALLTRPPLTFIRSKLQNQSVRLECVMHAASVHPEPGSNSRYHGIKTSPEEPDSISYASSSLLASLLLLSSILIVNCPSSVHKLAFLYFSLVVQFSRIRCCPFLATALSL